MNGVQALAAMHQGLATVRALAPLAALGGPAAAGVGKIAATLAEVGENVLENIERGVIVATSTDAADIKSILVQIQTENDALAARIAAS